MEYVLIAHSHGDELESSKATVVAVSPHRHKLEELRAQRQKEREQWLKGHQVAHWQKASVIAYEEIKEVPTL